MPTPNYSFVLSAQLTGSTTIAVGDVLITNSSSPTYYQLATSANRGTRRSEGVALTAYGGASVGDVQMQQTGCLDATTSGLGTAASIQLVRVSSAGRMERVTFAAVNFSTDDVIGIAGLDGRVFLYPGFPWSSVVTTFGGIPAGSSYQVQYNNGGSFGGATNVHIEGGDLVVYKTGGTVATTGAIRSTTGVLDLGAFELRVRDAANTRNLAVLTSYSATLSGSAKEVTTFGGYGVASSAPHYEWHYARAGFGFFLTTATPESQTNGVEFVEYAQAGPIGAWSYRRTWALQRHMNLVLMGTTSTLANPDTAIAGGEGVMGIGRAEYAPTTSPGSGFITAWVDSSDRWNYVRSNGQKVPIWDGPQNTNSSDGTLNDVSTLDANSLPARVIRFSGGTNITLNGLDNGREGRTVWIFNDDTDAALFVAHQAAGSTAANRIITPDGDTYSVPFATGVPLVYDTSASRWLLVGPSQEQFGLTGRSVSVNGASITDACDALGGWSVTVGGTSRLAADDNGVSLGAPLMSSSGAVRFKSASITFASANYTLSASEMACLSLYLGGVTGGARDLIGPNTTDATYFVRNNTADIITLKKSGGAGVAIASGAFGMFQHNGTEYVQIA